MIFPTISACPLRAPQQQIIFQLISTKQSVAGCIFSYYYCNTSNAMSFNLSIDSLIVTIGTVEMLGFKYLLNKIKFNLNESKHRTFLANETELLANFKSLQVSNPFK